ncbi:MAG: hypothetical protein ACKOD3_08395 [Phenylobacterium sp.]
MTFTSPDHPPPDLSSLGVRGDRPLLIVDVDEVLGLFMEGFARYLATHGYEMRFERFALFQNIYRPGEDEHIDLETGQAHFQTFFRDAVEDMPVAEGGPEALGRLSTRADVVILTNAPGQALAGRARWLKKHGMDYPLLVNSGLKGPVAAALAAQAAGPAAFIDDMIPNLDSVAEHAPEIARFQTVADTRLRPMAPSRPDLHPRIDGWEALEVAISEVLEKGGR